MIPVTRVQIAAKVTDLCNHKAFGCTEQHKDIQVGFSSIDKKHPHISGYICRIMLLFGQFRIDWNVRDMAIEYSSNGSALPQTSRTLYSHMIIGVWVLQK